MTAPVRVLIVEDNPDDADLVRHELRRSADVVVERVETREGLSEALGRAPWDIIVADHSMPGFSARDALKMVRAVDPDVPFVLVSGTIDEETAVAVMRDGANDFILKGRLARLGPAVDRELREARVRREGRVAAEALRESEARLGAIVRTTADGIILGDRTGVVEFLNPAAERLFGLRSDEAAARGLDGLLPGLLADLAVRSGRGRWEGIGRRRDGTGVPVDLAWSDARVGDRELLTLSVRDVGDRKRLEARLAHQATHDGLTGLPGRELLVDRLAMALARTREWRGVAVLFLDLDRFKLVNDGLGHMAGDALLVAVAERLRGALRPSDTIARLGGDEFVVIVEGVRDHHEVSGVAERIMDAVRPPFALEGAEIFVTASIGVSIALDPAADPQVLIRDADAALYHAKERGRDRVEVFDERVRRRVVDRLETETGLHRALQRGELRLHFQPMVAVEDGRVVGCESLVRWQHPERGLLPPAAFIPMAEETGLIAAVSDFVLAEACRQAVAWATIDPDLSEACVSVNISRRLLSAGGLLLRSVSDALAASGLAPARLCLEITETLLMDDVEMAVRVIGDLAERGVAIAVDDFGTGYSSLGALKQIPAQLLKIDREFIAGMESDPRDASVIEAVVALAPAFGMRTVAEGVETPSQLERLRRLGCDIVQGYQLARPVPADELGELLATRPWQAAVER